MKNYTVNLEIGHPEYLTMMDIVDSYTDHSVIEQVLEGVEKGEEEKALVNFYAAEFMKEALICLSGGEDMNVSVVPN